MKSAWYGKDFYWVELPRRFMVTMWVTTMWLMIAFLKQGQVFPHYWIFFVLAIITDFCTGWRAPDVKITEEEIEALASTITRPIYILTGELVGKTQREVDDILDKADRFYFLTVKEVWHRFFVLCGSSVLLSLLSAYWFYSNQQPIILTDLCGAFVIACQLAYFSAQGITLKTKYTLAEGDRPFKVPFYTTLSTRIGFAPLGSPFGFYLAMAFALALSACTMDYSSIDSQKYTGDWFGYMWRFVQILFINSILLHVIFLRILDSKIKHVLTKH
jgi:hypothetical protein